MGVSESDFFREVALRICSSLEIEKALLKVFHYVREIMPADEIMLGTYDESLSILEIVARADASGSVLESVKVPYPQELKKTVTLNDIIYRQHIKIIDDHTRDILSIQTGEFYRWPVSSLLMNSLILENRYYGFIGIRAAGTGRFTPEHASLWVSIREPAAIALTNYLTHRELIELKEHLADDNRFLKEELRTITGTEIIGADFGLKQVMHQIELVAPLASPVFLQGETGTGKEVLANAVHNFSPRRLGPFIKVNCGAIPETLVDSELFGHEKGAFTGALTLKKGRFERAHGGTIFLDEIGELPLSSQVRLLRVLQEKEIERVGGTSPIKVDIRVISGTHRDIERMVKDKLFREDLYFRLKVFPITIPPLRSRKPDIPVLVHHILKKKSQAMGLPWIPVLAPGALDRLVAYDWPGNVRELENAIERSLILSHGEALEFADFPRPDTRPEDTRQDSGPEREIRDLDRVMKQHIEAALAQTGGRVEGRDGAARLLGVHPSTLRNRMRKLHIPFGRKTVKGVT